jgi:cell division septal protein FtsQ
MKVKAQTEKNFRRAKGGKPARKRAVQRRFSWRIASYSAIALLLLVAVYRATDLVLHASTLQVQRIVVRGNARLSTGEVQALVSGLRGKNILTVDIARYRDRLLDSVWVGDAALRRVLPSTIEVFISERQPIALCRLAGRLYLMDRSGMLMDEFGPSYAQFDLPIVDGVVRAPSTGQPLVDEGRLALAARVIDSLQADETLADRVSQIDVSNERNAAVLLDDDPTLLYLGDEKFAERLNDYLGLAERFRETLTDVEYIDLRFGKHITAKGAKARGTEPAGRN